MRKQNTVRGRAQGPARPSVRDGTQRRAVIYKCAPGPARDVTPERWYDMHTAHLGRARLRSGGHLGVRPSI